MILIHNGENISSRYHGERPLMAKYHGDKLVWLKENDWRNQYQQVEYIEATGQQYINTGYIVNENSRVEMDITFTGYFDGEAQHNGVITRTPYTSRFYYGQGVSGTDTVITLGIDSYNIVKVTDTDIHNAVLDNKELKGYFDLTEYTFSSRFKNGNLSFYLGALNDDGKVNYYCHEKIYAFNIKEGDNVIMNLIPVYRRKDGVAGMYDIVNKKFYKSETSTEFNAGKEIVGRLPYGFTEVEYIQSNGQQYLNTGYIVNENSRVELKLSYTSNEGTQHNGMLIRESSLSRFYAGYYSIDNAFLLGIVGYKGMGEYDELIHTFILDNSIKTGWFDSSNYVFNNPYQNKGLTFYLGAANENGRTNYYCHEKIYAFSVKEGSKILMNLVPCIRESDGVAGMYDMIGGKFYKSETETEFNAGRKVIVRLPEEYQEVEYIKSNGSSWINTGYIPNGNTKVEVSLSYEIQTGLGAYFLGARQSWKVKDYTLSTGRNSKLEKWGYLFNNYGTSGLQTEEYVSGGEKHLLVKDKNKIYHNGVLVSTATAETFDSGLSMYLFNINAKEQAVGNAPMVGEMYYCKIYDNGTIIRNFIPCIRKKDNIAGMYDTIGKKFYKSETSTEFVAGPIASGEQLEFISNDNLNYIDTGLKLKSSYVLDFDYQLLTSEENNRGVLYGTRGTNTTGKEYSLNNSFAVINRPYIVGAETSTTSFDLWTSFDSEGSKRRYMIDENVRYNRHKVNFDETVLKIDGTVIKTTSKLSEFTTTQNAFIFSNPYVNLSKTEKDPEMIVKSKVYEITVKDNKSQVLQSLLPCKINGEIGLLDTVSKVFFTGELYGKPFISN